VQSFRKVKFTNLQKILYPNLGITKYQIIDYYIKTAPKMLNFLQDRAITLNRFPDGINKEGFWEKDAPKGKPYWVKTFRRYSETAQRDVEYIVCNNVETLAWLANLAALEINIPLHKTNSPEKPDLLLFDIDPEPPANFNHAIQVAHLLKEKLDLLGLKSYIKTTGQKGLHIVLPIEPKYTFRQTLAFVHTMGQFLAKESGVIVSEFRQSKIPGTVYVDYMQNIRFKTMICPYSLRANEHATISTPLEWQEVKKGLKPEDFNIFNVLKRKIDPWKGLFEHKQTLDFEDIEVKRRKSSTETEEQTPAPLQEYAQKRNFTKTKEPKGHVIEEPENIFVVQEHHARRLHYDFRLAREGVLKSWAVPKGIPEAHGIRRLAIQTEDHPLEYSDFEGTIPKGQYGAGTVKIWDKGSYELKIWTEDKIEFFLKGSKLHGMYVLVKLKKADTKPRKQNEWLLIKMKD
jgi:DNA ligase D-like protein (predicted polymerase)/DNA ligase D-like protein (predicted 3'-phosphoesterase)